MSGSSGDEDDDPINLTANHFKLLLNHCSLLSKKVLNNDNPNLDDSESVIESFCSVRKMVKAIFPHLRDFLAGRINFYNVEEAVQEFIFNYSIFSHRNGAMREDRPMLLEIQLTLSAIEKDLKMSWNTERLEVAISVAKKRTTAARDGQSSSSCTKVQHEQFPEASTPKKRSIQTEDEPSSTSIKFAKVSPVKSELLPVFNCTLCLAKFSWLKTLKRHMKTSHGAVAPPGLREAEKKITCKICTSKITRDQINKHITNVHNLDRGNSSYVFRGFWTFNGSHWHPVWLPRGESDPPAEIMVPVVNGKINAFGINIDVEQILGPAGEEVEEYKEGPDMKGVDIKTVVVVMEGAVDEMVLEGGEVIAAMATMGEADELVETEVVDMEAVDMEAVVLEDLMVARVVTDEAMVENEEGVDTEVVDVVPVVKEVSVVAQETESTKDDEVSNELFGPAINSDNIEEFPVEEFAIEEEENEGFVETVDIAEDKLMLEEGEEEVMTAMVETEEGIDMEGVDVMPVVKEVSVVAHEAEATKDGDVSNKQFSLDINSDNIEETSVKELSNEEGEVILGTIGKLIQERGEDVGLGIKEVEDEFFKDDDKAPKIRVTFFSEDCKKCFKDVQEGEFWSAPTSCREMDSDFEDFDDKDYTEGRQEMKSKRMKRRNFSEPKEKLFERKENADVISQFEEFLRNDKFETATNDSDLSTVRKMVGHLFTYDDSLLNFLNSKTEHYSLACYFNPDSEHFLEVEDPSVTNGWIQEIGGKSGKENPGRRKEKLKSHARWRDFVAEKIQGFNFGSSAEAFYRKEMMIKNIEQITVKIKRKQIFSKLTKLEEQNRIEKLKAKSVINPNNSYLEQKAVKQWYLSQEAKDEERECMKIYDKSIAGASIGSKEFLRFANWSRFSLVLDDRNRRGVYNFSNKVFGERVPKWLPPSTSDDSSEDVVDKFLVLPDNWNADSPPTEGAEPSCYVINMSGSSKGLKGQKAAQIILTPRVLECCLKFQDIKQNVLDNVQADDNFFVNGGGRALAAIQRTNGSLLDKLGKAVGVTDVTVNSFRRAAETVVQASPCMKSKVENLQSHSNEVGLKHYDRSQENIRASFITQLSCLESSRKASKVPDAVQKKRKKAEEEEREMILKQAKEMLLKDKLKKNNKKGRINSEDRLFTQNYFSTSEINNLKPSERFPGDLKWKKVFYRAVDSPTDPAGDKLREIEEEVFAEIIKFEVEEEMGPWTGSADQNRVADQKIAGCIKSAFKSYEKTRKPFQESYFEF